PQKPSARPRARLPLLPNCVWTSAFGADRPKKAGNLRPDLDCSRPYKSCTVDKRRGKSLFNGFYTLDMNPPERKWTPVQARLPADAQTVAIKFWDGRASPSTVTAILCIQ